MVQDYLINCLGKFTHHLNLLLQSGSLILAFLSFHFHIGIELIYGSLILFCTHVDLQLELCSSPMIESYDCLYLMVKEWGFSLHFDVILLHWIDLRVAHFFIFLSYPYRVTVETGLFLPNCLIWYCFIKLISGTHSLILCFFDFFDVPLLIYRQWKMLYWINV